MTKPPGDTQFYIFSHTDRKSKFRGPTDILLETFCEMGLKSVLVENDLTGKGNTIIYSVNEKTGNRVIIQEIKKRGSGILRYFNDFLGNIRIAKSLLKNKKAVVVCVNPLNGLSGLIIKKIGLCKGTAFISADYSKKRFGNAIMDYLYKYIDKFVTINSDLTGSVSTRIQNLRKSFGLSTNKNFFLPNTPSHKEFEKYKLLEKKKHTLVSIGSLSDQLSYYTMFDAINSLKSKYPDIRLKIIGGGEKEVEYKKYISNRDLKSEIIFMGWLSHDDALKEVATCQIGLAMYSGEWNFNYFGDSMKIREYIGLRLPVITTDTHSTVDDIKKFKSGFVIMDDSVILSNKIDYLFKNQESMADYSKNCTLMARSTDGLYQKFVRSLQIID